MYLKETLVFKNFKMYSSKKNILKFKIMANYGLRILLHAFPLDDVTRFFIYLVKNMIFRKDLESPLIFVLFLKGKQNKKENPKCDPLFGKDNL